MVLQPFLSGHLWKPHSRVVMTRVWRQSWKHVILILMACLVITDESWILFSEIGGFVVNKLKVVNIERGEFWENCRSNSQRKLLKSRVGNSETSDELRVELAQRNDEKSRTEIVLRKLYKGAEWRKQYEGWWIWRMKIILPLEKKF